MSGKTFSLETGNKWIRCPEPILQFCQFVSRLAGARNYIDGIERMSRDRKF